MSDTPRTQHSSLGECVASWLANGRHLLVALEAYFDGAARDGNWSEEGSLVTLAGFAAEDDVWVGFDTAWNAILKDDSRRPAAPYLHMREAVHRKGPFQKRHGWNLKKVGYLVTDLLQYMQTVDKQRFHQFGCTIDLRAYRAYKQAGFPVMQNHFEMCNQFCPFTVLAWHITTPGLMKSMHFFFDKDEAFKEHFERRWKAEKANNLRLNGMDYFWSMIRCVCTADMRDKPALQAADLLAWGTNRSFSEEGKSFKHLEHVMKQIIPSSWIVWDEARFVQEFGPLQDRGLLPMKVLNPDGDQFGKFNSMMEKLISVPHSAIKAKLDAEKAAKKKKRKAKRPSASGRATSEKG